VANISEKYGASAIILGSAEGLGKAFVDDLILRGFTTLYLLDNNKKALALQGKKIKEKHKIKINQIHNDLNDESTWQKISQLILSNQIGLIIFNAAYGPIGFFKSQPSEQIEKIFRINIQCVTTIMWNVIHNRPKEFQFGIIIMSSLSAFYGGIGIAPYAASKAYLLTLGRSLYRELKPFGLDILTCCPGIIDTPGLQSSKPNKSSFQFTLSSPDYVARKTLDVLGKKAIIIPGRINRLSYFIFNRLLPYSTVHQLVDKILDQMYNLNKQNINT
jgi:short-subunit dehydrogenase